MTIMTSSSPAENAGARVSRPRSDLVRATSAGLIAAGYLALIHLLTLHTSLLKPFHAFVRDSGFLWYLVAVAIASIAYGLAQRFALGLSSRQWVSVTSTVFLATPLVLLFFELERGMQVSVRESGMARGYLALASGVVRIVLSGVVAWIAIVGAGALKARTVVGNPVFALAPVMLAAVTSAPQLLASGAVLALCWGLLRRVRTSTRAQTLGGKAIRTLDAVVQTRSYAYAILFLSALPLRAAYAIRVTLEEAQKGLKWGDANAYEEGAFRGAMNGYAIFLRWIYQTFGHSYVAVGVAQSVLSAMVCVWTYEIGRRYVSARWAFLAGALAVINGPLWMMASQHAREILLTFVMTLLFLVTLGFERGPSLPRSLATGFLLGALAVIKLAVAPIGLAVIAYRVRQRLHRVRDCAFIAVTAVALVVVCSLNDPGSRLPIGSSARAYAAFNYFAGNHPLTGEDRWFSLGIPEYEDLESRGFKVGPDAGTPEAYARFKAEFPHIAYFDPTTFTENTVTLIEYNLRRPAHLVTIHAANFVGLFIGRFWHHDLIDPMFLVNRTAYSYVSRTGWVLLCVLGWIALYRTARRADDRNARTRLEFIALAIGLLAAVYTVFLGVHYYLIPVIPILLVLNAAALRFLVRSLAPKRPA